MRKIIAIVPLVAAAALSMTTSASAEAGPGAGGSVRSALDGSCQAGEFCLYYNGGHQGSFTDFELG